MIPAIAAASKGEIGYSPYNQMSMEDMRDNLFYDLFPATPNEEPDRLYYHHKIG
jgi:hypothetical protein